MKQNTNRPFVHGLQIFFILIPLTILWEGCIKNTVSFEDLTNQTIVFSSTNPISGFSHLHTIRTSGDELHILKTDSSLNYDNFVWSRQNASVFFTKRSSSYSYDPVVLYQWDIRSEHKDSLVVLNGNRLRHLQCNPKSGELLFSLFNLDSAFTQICKLRLNDLRTVCLFSSYTQQTAPSWSPDKKRIAFYFTDGINRGIFIMNSDGSHKEQISSMPHSYLPEEPVWSEDGKSVFFIEFSGFDNVYSIHRCHVTTRQVDTLYSAVETISGLACLPGRPQILFRKRTTAFNTPQLYVLDISDRTTRIITYDAYLHGATPLKRQGWILLLSAITGYDNFYKLKTDGSALSQISYFRKGRNIVSWTVSP